MAIRVKSAGVSNRWKPMIGKPIDQLISIDKINNWYQLVSVNRWSIDNHTKTVHRLVSIGTFNSNRRHARYLSDHPPFLGSPGDKIGKKFWPSLLNAKNKHRCMCTRITHLPVIAFPFHYVKARSPGRGSAEYKMRRQRLSSLPFRGECRRSVYRKQEEGIVIAVQKIPQNRAGNRQN